MSGERPDKRAGARRGARAPVRVRPVVAAYAVAAVGSAALWGFLVFLAIRWGAQARGGDGPGWAAFGVVSALAVAVLFGGLMLVARLSRAVGLTSVDAGEPHRH